VSFALSARRRVEHYQLREGAHERFPGRASPGGLRPACGPSLGRGGSGENPDAVAGADLLSSCARRFGPGACCGRQQGHPAADQGQSRAGRARGGDRGRRGRVS
jgi:hypothetical protein